MGIPYSLWYLMIPVVFFLIFLISWFKEKRKIVNGFLFNLFMLSVYVGLAMYAIVSQNVVVLFIVMVLTILLFMSFGFGIYALILFLLWNARQVMKKEGRALQNRLSFLLGLGLLGLLLIEHLPYHYPQIAHYIFLWVHFVLLYFFLLFFNYFVVNVLYQFNRPRYPQEFIVVLGAGLIDGLKVTPLLAQRIDRAIRFYKKQQKAGFKAPKLVMSGGQGPDEKISEAEAMGNYASEQGIDRKDILLETHSVNTLENMKFSKEIIEEKKKGAKVIFSSSDYHIFRASLFAKKVGLQANGIGSKTVFYYLPNAFLREFAAVIVKKKKRHVIVLTICSMIYVAFVLLSYYLQSKGLTSPITK